MSGRDIFTLIDRRAPQADPKDFAPGLLRIQKTPMAPLAGVVLKVVLVMLGLLVLWAAFGKLDIVATADGKLLPAGYLKIVQPSDQLPQRSSLVPDVPTLKEAGQKDLDVILYAGFVGPAGNPRDVVERLNRDINAALSNPEVNAQIEKLSFTLTPSKADAFGAMLRDQLGVYRKAVREAGLPVE